MKVEEFKKKVEERVKEYIWCLNNGIEKREYGGEYNRFGMIVYDVEKEGEVLVGFWIKWYGVKVDCRELVELKKVIEIGSGGSFVCGYSWNLGCKIGYDWRFRIEKDEDCNEDGWYIDEEKNEVGFFINGWLSKKER